MLDLRSAPSKIYTAQAKQAYFDIVQIFLTSGTDSHSSVLMALTAPKHVNTHKDTRAISSINNMAEAENLAWSILADCFGETEDIARDHYERFAEYLFCLGGNWRLAAHQIYEWVNAAEEEAIPSMLFDEDGEAYKVMLTRLEGKQVYEVVGRVDTRKDVRAV